LNVIRHKEGAAKIRSWLPENEIEPGAMDQIRQTASHPEAAHAIAIMPDCHVGFGVTIGCVFPTVGAIVPNAVGVDIGCGMCAVNTGIRLEPKRHDKKFWRAWMGDVQRDVPSGFGTHRTDQPLGDLDRPLRAAGLQSLMQSKANRQIGTLGGGNHFLEAQVDEEGSIWLMVHSGSRHTGLRIANDYHKLAIASSTARGLMAKSALSSLRLDEQDGQNYLHDMEWATDFALESRTRMIRAMVEILARRVERFGDDLEWSDLEVINIHHNFASIEEHNGESLIVHRKGATSAANGQIGIIPGSMGSSSYIVRGLGNSASFNSCSHGAGRKMSRGRAKDTITSSQFEASLKGTFSSPSMGYVDEAPGAYKDIGTVIGRQADLVEILHTLRPIITIKGDSKAKDD
jgi:tRNA-splicing ligase RtcB